MNVTNNYYGQQQVPDMLNNQLNTPITYYRAEMYVTNNYFKIYVKEYFHAVKEFNYLYFELLYPND